MVKRTLPTNPMTRHTIKVLRKASSTNNADIWRALSDSLCAPTRGSTSVNLSKIDVLASEGDCVAVPGKVLGFGSLTKKVDVAALSFSQSAREKIAQAGGRSLTLEALVGTNPRGKGVKVLK
jgi:large subunit ribosomal protein L18e